jgi:GNAT superfamily N-acetyltransferase
MTSRAENRTPDARPEGPRALRPHEHPSAIRLLNYILRPDGPPSLLEEYPLVLGMDNIENMRVMVKDSEVISHAAVYFSTLVSGNMAFKVGGIGSVATHPSYRGQGLASMVIKDCIRIMEEAGCHLSVLWTQRHDFYRNLGYETAGSEYLFKVSSADLRHISCGCEIVQYSPPHLHAIMELHNQETLRTERTKTEWEAYFGIPKSGKLLALRGDRVTAYAVMGKGEDLKRCVLDWGGDLEDLLCLIREFAGPAGGEIMILVPAYLSELGRTLERMRLPKVFEYLAMVRVIDAEAVSSVIQEHVRNLLGEDFRILQTESGFRIRVGDQEAAVPDERALSRILFGPNAASNLLRDLPRKSASALDKAFPIPLFIWGLDSV